MHEQSPIWASDMLFSPEASSGLYYMSANSIGSGETALTRRLTRAFAGRLYDKYSFLMCWVIYGNIY